MDLVIQTNMLSNSMLLAVKEAVSDLPHQFVGLIPFSREITSNQPIVGLDHIPWGSTSFVETTYALGWKGLSFDPHTSSYEVCCENRNDMLNSGNILPAGTMIKFLQTLDPGWQIFMRPAHDLKQFTGALYLVQEAINFLKDAMSCTSSGSYKVDPELLIVMNWPQDIIAECRWFIVGGQVIDGSLYRCKGELFKSHVDDAYLQLMAQTLADKWLPDPCCVMDLALLKEGETKVVEFNCINGSGFYDHNIKKVMTAWSKYHDN